MWDDPVEHIRSAIDCHPSFKDGLLKRLVTHVIDDARFPLWTGSGKSTQHHYGKGGLARHTREVMMLCMRNAIFAKGVNKPVDETVLFLSAIFHDFGKLWDYQPRRLPAVSDRSFEFCDWEATSHKRNINHLCRSAVEWVNIARKENTPKDIEDAVLHCILAHHAEFGSPVLPKSREAWILHLSDGMSARIDSCDTLDLSKK